jgi:hypothetical protein
LISLFHQPLPLADNEIERRDDMARHAHRTAKEPGVVPDQHNEEEEIYFRAQAFHKAAKILVKAFGVGTAPRMESETLPIISMYHQAAELHLKAIVLGYGGNFLPVRPVLARIRGTHSLQALVVLACQILEGVGWEQGFKTEGVADLCDLRAVIEKLEALDITLRAFRPDGDKRILIGSLAATITDFAKQVDAVLDILDAAADGLVAMADAGRLDGESEFDGGGLVQ